jgi:poly(A) polymerase
MVTVTRQFEAALGIVGELRAAGYEAYFAGGCVRDLMLGREPVDYDVATSATPEVVLEMFPRTFAVGAHFGVVLVATCGGADGACVPGEDATGYTLTEVATFRSDGAYSDGRHPDAVRYTTSAAEDVRRRDFTINGLLLDPVGLGSASALEAAHPSQKNKDLARVGHPAGLAGLASGNAGPSTALRCAQDHSTFLSTEDAGTAVVDPGLRLAVIDFVGGIADLEAGVVRAIGRAELRFDEDHLRMLRGVRFAARFGFELETATAAAMRRLAAKTASVSRERVRDELTKMLTEGRARRAFELLDETGLLREVLPEVARMKGVEQPAQFHPEGDVWTHTLMLLEQLEAGCSMTLAWGALLHDVGKPPTFRRAPERIRFDGHVEVGVAMGAEICRRFRFSNEETRQTLALIENHMRFADAGRMKASTLKRFFRLEGFEEHLALHRMDCMAASGNLEGWEFVRERYLAMPEEAVRPKPLITGRELIAAGYVPGSAFKEMLRTVEDAQLEGSIQTPEEALRLVRDVFPLCEEG